MVQLHVWGDNTTLHLIDESVGRLPSTSHPEVAVSATGKSTSPQPTAGIWLWLNVLLKPGANRRRLPVY
jgi:hypothetical protein